MTRGLAGVINTFKKWLAIDDPGMLEFTLGAVAANRIDGDPVWGLLVGGSSTGKSETLNALLKLGYVLDGSVMTEGGLLSGVADRDVQSGSTGGLLREIERMPGGMGILINKDFTSTLSMPREARASVLGALREIYDGRWTRRLGTGGGMTYSWAGKVGLLAGCTDTIDRYHEVMSAMGERFVMYRMPPTNEREQARKSRLNRGREAEMREELSQAVYDFMTGIDFNAAMTEVDEDDGVILDDLGIFTARCRSPVERDGFSREISLVPTPEAPGRLTRMYTQLFIGLQSVGVERDETLRVLGQVALGTVPSIRRKVLENVMSHLEPPTVIQISEETGYPYSTARRALEDLAAHGVLVRHMHGNSHNAHRWALSDWCKYYAAILLGE